MSDLVIGIEDVLSVYREALGSGALLVNGFVRKTVATRDGTAAIDKNGTFYYCPDWFKEYVTSPSRFRDIVMHELMHPVIGDMSRDMGWLPNVAGDIVINAMLYTLGLSPCELQEATYSPRQGPECLLRPRSTPPKELLGIYASVYPGAFRNLRSLEICQNPLQIMQALQVIYGNDASFGAIMLLGGHSGQDPTETLEGEHIPPDIFGVPGEVINDVAEICSDILDEKRKAGGGYGADVGEMVVNVIKSRKRIRSELLKGFESKNTANKLRQYFKGVRASRSIVPTQMTKNEASKIAMGIPPLYYKRKREVNDSIQKRGIAFYLDVSGSVYEYLPTIIGIFDSLREDIEAVYAFSNQVVEIKRDDFLSGKLRSTGGTDFNCVIKHAVEHKYPKVLVFTDGDAHADEDSRMLARRNIEKMGLVYFGNYTRANWIEEQYGCKFFLQDILAPV